MTEADTELDEMTFMRHHFGKSLMNAAIISFCRHKMIRIVTVELKLALTVVYETSAPNAVCDFIICSIVSAVVGKT